MFGPRITHVFRSRWHALAWSAGVLATAYCSIPAPDDAPQNGTDSQAQAAQAQQVMSAWTSATGAR